MKPGTAARGSLTGKTRVAVAMSGGVDSSVAALLLKQEGYDVVGVTMMLLDFDAGPGCGKHAFPDARKAAMQLGIPHHLLDFRKEFGERVIRYFCDEYGCGRTPNPCIRCNEKIKFGLLLDRARGLGAARLATGHYARLEQNGEGRLLLNQGADKAKDQSYFLYRLTQEQMAQLEMPLGGFTKNKVRTMAKEHGLPVAEKQESQEVCFVTDDDYAGFLHGRRPGLLRPGRVVDTEGNELGRHDGIAGFTIGQRKGLGIALGERRYVVRLDVERNEVVLGRYDEALADTAELDQVHWVSGEEPKKPQRALAKVRYQHSGGQATVFPEGDRARVKFDEPQFAVTPGQSIVFYDEDTVLGGGIIEKSK